MTKKIETDINNIRKVLKLLAQEVKSIKQYLLEDREDIKILFPTKENKDESK